MTRRKQYISYFFALSITSAIGCAHMPTEQAKITDSSAMKTRLEETERTNGRLNVRVEELEDQLFLLQDRVDSNRIALQRRGIWGQSRQARNDAPPAAPESYRQKYGARTPKTFVKLESGRNDDDDMYEYYDDEDFMPRVNTKKRSRRRYENGKQVEDVVITEKEYNAFIQENGYDSTTPEKRNRSVKKTKKVRTPQPNVTDEKLLTTKQIRAGAEPRVSRKPGKKNGLALYKESLAYYRSGDYSSALSGFEGFLKSGPKEDYIDNALYWIGECHFGLGSHAKAASFFKRVMTEQPDGNKIPDSMLKMALAFVKMGKIEQAKKLLSNVSKQYPRTNAGKLGAQKLSEL